MTATARQQRGQVTANGRAQAKTSSEQPQQTESGKQILPWYITEHSQGPRQRGLTKKIKSLEWKSPVEATHKKEWNRVVEKKGLPDQTRILI